MNLIDQFLNNAYRPWVYAEEIVHQLSPIRGCILIRTVGAAARRDRAAVDDNRAAGLVVPTPEAMPPIPAESLPGLDGLVSLPVPISVLFRQAPVSRLAIAEQVLHDAKDMLHFGAR